MNETASAQPAPPAGAAPPSPQPVATDDIARTLGIGRRVTPLWRRWWVLGAAALLIASGAWWLQRTPPKPQYLYGKATIATIRVRVTATGTLQPVDKITVGAEVSGRVQDILVDFNDRVRKGQILARLNTDELEARAVQTRAGVAQARANLLKANHDFARARDLRARGFVSQESHDQALTTRDLAVAALHSATAVSRQAEVSLAKAAIRSPIDGIVLDRKVERGQTVAASFQTPELFVIASDLTQLELTVDVDEADVGDLRVGQSATFTVDAYPSRSFSARVLELRNAAHTVANVVTYQGVLDVKNAAGLLKPGMTATADIVVRVVPEVLTVANRALRFAPPKPGDGEGIQFGRFGKTTSAPAAVTGKGQLWTTRPDGQPQPRAVTLGPTDGRLTQITSDNVRVGEAFILDVMPPPGGTDEAPRASVEIN